ncbi:uncharacterized protein RSE6_11613 [Rhynchosporium secalis]|uniref:Uncharacterized protein n=1 Tax=Rhynchosporium secalis TaxID=38038 RepID=A0A1E1MNE1_RHYSE|nr:uncharacterized protein RSE6_11613 [Rhynchosporium secalis]
MPQARSLVRQKRTAMYWAFTLLSLLALSSAAEREVIFTMQGGCSYRTAQCPAHRCVADSSEVGAVCVYSCPSDHWCPKKCGVQKLQGWCSNGQVISVPTTKSCLFLISLQRPLVYLYKHRYLVILIRVCTSGRQYTHKPFPSDFMLGQGKGEGFLLRLPVLGAAEGEMEVHRLVPTDKFIKSWRDILFVTGKFHLVEISPAKEMAFGLISMHVEERVPKGSADSFRNPEQSKNDIIIAHVAHKNQKVVTIKHIFDLLEVSRIFQDLFSSVESFATTYSDVKEILVVKQTDRKWIPDVKS